MREAISAYLTIYNDYDILPHTLRAIAPYIDELIVVDGAYEWMVPYLEIAGKNLLKSDAPVYEALEASGIKYRVESRIWRHEAEKRMAGYSACNGRYAFRIDADEVPFFDDSELEKFLSSGRPIAGMYKPTYISPQWLLALDASGLLPAEPFLFDRTRVAPDIHLNYLWLVLGPDQLPSAGSNLFTVYQPHIGFNAHLNMWRDLQSKIGRATFYWLQTIRQRGVPWLPELRDKPLSDIRTLFKATPPEVFRELILSSLLFATQGFRMLGWYSARSPLTGEQESLFIDRFDCMRKNHAQLNRTIAEKGLTFWPAMPIILDLSSPESTEAIAADNAIKLSTTCALSAVSAKLHLLVPRHPWHVCTELECDRDGSSVIVRLPENIAPYSYLRREVDISLSTDVREPLQRFRVTR